MSDFPDYEAAQRVQDAGRAAVSIVDVALGDEPLYRRSTWQERYDDIGLGVWIQVWPKEDNDG